MSLCCLINIISIIFLSTIIIILISKFRLLPSKINPSVDPVGLSAPSARWRAPTSWPPETWFSFPSKLSSIVHGDSEITDATVVKISEFTRFAFLIISHFF